MLHKINAFIFLSVIQKLSYSLSLSTPPT